MGNLGGTWSHAEAFAAFLQTHTDLCLYNSAVQCTVIPARSYRELDMDVSTVLREDAVGDIIWSFKTQSSSMEVSDVLLFLAKLHRLPQQIKRSLVSQC